MSKNEVKEYEVISDFKDLQDNGHIYSKGDTYPHKGKSTDKRIKELTSNENKIGKPVIKERA